MQPLFRDSLPVNLRRRRIASGRFPYPFPWSSSTPSHADNPPFSVSAAKYSLFPLAGWPRRPEVTRQCGQTVVEWMEGKAHAPATVNFNPTIISNDAIKSTWPPAAMTTVPIPDVTHDESGSRLSGCQERLAAYRRRLDVSRSQLKDCCL